MKLRTVVLAVLAAGTVYAVRKHQAENTTTNATSNRAAHGKQGAARGSSTKTRTAIRQLQENSRHAPFPINIVLTVAAKLLGRRMDRK